MRYKNIPIILITVFLFLSTYASSNQQNGYKIKVNAPFSEGSVAYLASYWEGETYITDSIIVPQGGIFTFANINTELPTGQYLLYIKPDIRIELLLDNLQHNIEIDLDQKDLANSKIKGSKDTEVFWKYLKELNSLHADIEKYVNQIKETDKKTAKLAGEGYKATLIKIEHLTDKYIKNYEGTWFSSFIKASSPIREPHPIPRTREESIENSKFVKEHYFDKIDFTDMRLWRTVFFAPQLQNYLKEIIVHHPDTIAKEASWLVSKTITNDEAFEKMLSYLVNDATTSRAMGMENVWARLGEDYIFNKNLTWIDSLQYNNLKSEYALIEHNRIGMQGQNLNLRTIDGDSINTNDIEAELLVIYFYAPSCSYCQAEIPKLRNDIYGKYKDRGLKVIAINLDQNVESWKYFIEKNNMGEWYNAFDPNFKSEYWLKYDTSGTPSMYLLNRDKTIIAKKLNTENLNNYLNIILK